MLRTRAFDSVGVEQVLSALRWSSTDSSVIVVDSMGVAEARGRGVARIAAHTGTVSSAEMTIAVRAPSASLRMNEQWRDGLAGRWWSFGWPAPKLLRRGGAATLLVNGDGHLNSGIISREAYDASNGVGVRVFVQLPILRAQWQALLVRLDPIATDAQLQQWRTDERDKGQTPSSWEATRVSRNCVVRIPRREGGEYADLMSLTLSQREMPMLRAPRIADGRPHAITLQVLSDGRCALAIDDTVTAISEMSIRLDRPLRVTLEGQSADTEIEVRSVEVWTGLRSGIDWNATGPATRGGRRVGVEGKRPMLP